MKKLLLIVVVAMIGVLGGCSTEYYHTHYVLTEQCAVREKQQARQVQAMLAENAVRLELDNVVNYAWKDPWFDLSSSKQSAIVKKIITTEHCLSDGRITEINIFYAGYSVAFAGGGKIRVLKRKP